MIKAVAVVAVAPVYSKKFLRLAPLFNYKKQEYVLILVNLNVQGVIELTGRAITTG